ncbi:hypothetical protein V6Z12_A09G043600 [Gossypium hirsutum]
MQVRKLISIITCPLCGGGAENLDHLFQDCPVSVEVWLELGLSSFGNKPEMDFFEWLTWVFRVYLNQQRQVVCVALWAIWSDRNARIHDRKISIGWDIAWFITHYCTKLEGIDKRRIT